MSRTYFIKFTDKNLNVVKIENLFCKRSGTAVREAKRLYDRCGLSSLNIDHALIIHTPYDGCERLVDIVNF